MNKRFKLFLGIFLTTLLAVGFFGYIAFDSANRLSQQREFALLSDYGTQVSGDYLHDNGTAIDVEKIREWLGTHSSPGLHTLLLTADSATIEPYSSTPTPQVLKHRIIEGRNENNIGLRINDTYYGWTYTPLAKSGHSLVSIRATDQTLEATFFSTLATPLAVTSLIILWVAAWSAMFIGSLFQKLNKQQEDLKHLALHDALTSLPNRALLHDRLQQAINGAERDTTQIALLFIDLNHFKDINDSLGHHYGDQLLVELSKRFDSRFRRSDTVARLGGDEFAVILRNVNVESAQFVAKDLLTVIEEVVEIETNKLYVSASIGIALYPIHATDFETLIQRADTAMYSAKKGGINVQLYNPDLDQTGKEKLKLVSDLRNDLKSQRLEVYFQPKLDLATNTIVCAETLLRWNHATFGSILPEKFISAAEHAGLMHHLTERMFDLCLPRFQQLLSSKLLNKISINLSVSNFQDTEFEKMLLSLLEFYKIDPKHIIFEIKEKVLYINPHLTHPLLHRLSDMGFTFSIDDFGTGNSSLINLKKLPIGEIKIDNSLIQQFQKDPDIGFVIQAATNLAHALNMTVCAEGVEHQATLDLVKKMGCDSIQGNVYCEALSFEKLSLWLSEHLEHSSSHTNAG